MPRPVPRETLRRSSSVGVLAILAAVLFVLAVAGWIAFGAQVAVTADGASSPPVALSSELESRVHSTIRRVESIAASRGETTYERFAADPDHYAGYRVHVRNSDLRSGTARLARSGYFVLDESISFEPEPLVPVCNATVVLGYCADAYRLGFFAAFTVEAPSVVLDLNGFSIEQSPLFALEQRFFANIELASQPFIHGQGPADFGNELESANRVAIINGHLGRSSHHGIHGNAPAYVLVRNVTLSDYEVAGIHLNGASDVAIVDVLVNGSRNDMPVVATYSQARFLLPFIERALGDSRVSGAKQTELIRARDALLERMREAREDIVRSGAIDRSAHPQAYELFASAERIIDGNAYGIVISAPGVAVNGFGVGMTVHDARVLISNVSIRETRGHVVETITLARADTKATLKGPAGDVLRIASNSRANQPPPLFDESTNQGDYRGSALSDAQLALVDVVLDLPEEEVRRVYGTISREQMLIDWRDGKTSLQQLVENGQVVYLRNGDSMHHVQKGVIGLRIDGVANVLVRNCSIETTHNDGERGHARRLPGEAQLPWYRDGDDGGHPAQGLQDGYMGADVRGIAVAGSRNVFLERIRVADTHTYYGNARAIDVFNYAENVQLDRITVNGVHSMDQSRLLADAADGRAVLDPLRVGSAVGWHTSDDSSNVNVYDLKTSNVASGIACQALAAASETRDDDATALLARRSTAASMHDANVYT